jgi:glutamate racemase
MHDACQQGANVMGVDLFAGASYEGVTVLPMRAPTILVFDSGLGGLTVFREVVRARPDARFVYAADDAAFPYGRLGEAELVSRVVAVMDRLIGRFNPGIVVIACNTASTLVLPALRAKFPGLPFVGTVPAIKPAAEGSRTRHIAVLATPGTVKRDYTQELIRNFAGGCKVTLVGSTVLAGLAEAYLRGDEISDEAIAAEIAPCFAVGPRVDTVVLGCTHYPLLLDRLRALAPWPVTWIDPAPAIARRVVQLIGPAPDAFAPPDAAMAVLTSGAEVSPALPRVLAAQGLNQLQIVEVE